MTAVGSLFSGIGGLDLGLERAGYTVAWQCEIDPACRELLAQRFPGVPCYDDVRTVDESVPRVDVLCGGFPCQDVSVAGNRAGLAGARSGLFSEFMRVVGALTPRWLLIENVPGLLSSGHVGGCAEPKCASCDPGADMATVTGALADLGYGWAYRVLDAEYFGVAQRRRRVFIVGCLGDWASAAQVLFEPESCDGDSPPSRAAREEVAATLGSQPAGSGWRGDTDRMTFVPTAARCDTTRGGGRLDPSRETYIADTLRSHPRPGSNSLGAVVPIAFMHQAGGDNSASGAYEYDHTPTLPVSQTIAVAYPLQHVSADERRQNGSGIGSENDPSYTIDGTSRHGVASSENQRGEVLETPYARQLTTGGGKPGQGYPAVRSGMAVQRLTPKECERLQGFPDGWTEGFADSVRYRMLGNAVVVSVAEWIGRRMAAVDAVRLAA